MAVAILGRSEPHAIVLFFYAQLVQVAARSSNTIQRVSIVLLHDKWALAFALARGIQASFGRPQLIGYA